MLRRRSRVLLMVAASLWVWNGCSDDNVEPPTKEDSGALVDEGAAALTASITGAKAYEAVTGTVTLGADVTGSPAKVELLAAGKVVATATAAPFSFSWDTTTQKDGIVALQLACDGKAIDTSSLKVIVLNKGSEATFLDGTGGTISVPADGAYLDQHLKYHWKMPEGIQRIIGVLSWDNSDFELELAVGIGECPDSGEKAVAVKGKDAPIAAEYGNGKPLNAGQWFAHIDILNESDAATHGKKTTFRVKAYLLVD